MHVSVSRVFVTFLGRKSCFQIYSSRNFAKMGASNSKDTLKVSNDVPKGQIQSIDVEVNSYPVVIYTKTNCSYSKKAKSLLDQEKLGYKERDLQQLEGKFNDREYEDYYNGLIKKTNIKTVPQIFVCGKFIGGFDDLEALKNKRKLLDMVESCKEGYKNKP